MLNLSLLCVIKISCISLCQFTNILEPSDSLVLGKLSRGTGKNKHIFPASRWELCFSLSHKF